MPLRNGTALGMRGPAHFLLCESTGGRITRRSRSVEIDIPTTTWEGRLHNCKLLDTLPRKDPLCALPCAMRSPCLTIRTGEHTASGKPVPGTTEAISPRRLVASPTRRCATYGDRRLTTPACTPAGTTKLSASGRTSRSCGTAQPRSGGSVLASVFGCARERATAARPGRRGEWRLLDRRSVHRRSAGSACPSPSPPSNGHRR
jgi:hypothetical protein